ncbi:hypothetical protein, unknown function [Leishmania infantum JPCM5]|uniref:Uncharacterized protein n=2 Tax=Leishmania donovani species complex TaxID=38574 RepID=A4HRN7_LEIIN|nr:hypothetical protein, unknown function [Leishmania infantum JPCM5]XP_003857933.1 hypothetical protein, unknown function [Leishmania donovani]AYU75641.1 hypothetical protein LdCL_020009100 [Leishmania donovani]CAM65268.1 hypothetical protein, unknown function [Leishmania infantum JPCM5]CBZ31207.1 hypothetical protein, unknown function [Leishmania donovani]|eukprot:XP_001462729.1 hypothetical protein, unknown function [Leishmania infantum JPCM5]
MHVRALLYAAAAEPHATLPLRLHSFSIKLRHSAIFLPVLKALLLQLSLAR